MKKLFVSIFAVLLLAACQKENSTTKTDIRTDFIGSWKCAQTSKVIAATQFTVTITKDTANDARIKLWNFTKLGDNYNVYANVSTVAASALDIPVQTVKSNVIKGSGTEISTSKINFTYTIDDGNAIDTLTAVFTKL